MKRYKKEMEEIMFRYETGADNIPRQSGDINWRKDRGELGSTKPIE